MNILHISPNHDDGIECFEMFREGFNDIHLSSNSIDIDNDLNNIKLDFIFYETDTSNYLISIIQSIITILRNQRKNGIALIKIGNIFYKPVVDILYFLSSIYEKVYISKPSTNNIPPPNSANAAIKPQKVGRNVMTKSSIAPPSFSHFSGPPNILPCP